MRMQMRLKAWLWVLVLLLVCQATGQNLVLLSPADFVQTFRQNKIKVIASPIGLKPQSGILHGKIALASPLSACIDVDQVGQQQDQQDIFLLADDTGCLESVKAHNLASSGTYIGLIKRNLNNTLHDRQINIVHIPILEIQPNDYDRIVGYLERNVGASISVVADFNRERDEGERRINMEVWMSPVNLEAYRFVLELRSFVLNQQGSIRFQPHYALHSQTNRKQYIGCYSSGRFCPAQLEYQGQPQGAKIVGQSLRQIVIASQSLPKWFDYIAYFYQNCLLKQPQTLWQAQNSELCSEAAMLSSNIDYREIAAEIEKSFLGPRPEVDSNLYLEEERQLYIGEKITEFPGVVVNGRLWGLGDIEVSEIRVRVCNMIHPDPTLQTPECQNLTNPPMFSTGQLLIIIALLLVLLAGTMAICKLVIYRRMKKQMKGQVDKTLSQYYKYMDTFQDPDHSAVGRVPLVEPKLENNQLGSVELAEIKNVH